MTSVKLLAVLALLGVTGLVEGQAYPARNVTFIVPFPPGGGTDISARTVAAKLSSRFPHAVIVENRGGAAGILGANAVASAKPDGDTLLIANVGTQSINPSLYPKLPYNPDTAFAPVSLICELPFVLMASPSFAPNSVKELVAFAKANPDKVTFASSGSGGSPHLTAEIFQLATGTKLLHVPYKGGGPAIPDVPTLAEAGVKGGESGSWIALLAPAGTPQAIIDRLAADVKEVVAAPDIREKLVAQGAVPQSSTPAELQRLIDSDRARYGLIIREKGLKAE
jgi:tripartite-type tricarboxylate transporter receptor subunit TctC